MRLFDHNKFLCILLAWLILADCRAQSPELEVEAGSGDEVYEDDLEEVIVLGSRLIRSNLDSPAPVTVYSSDELINTGVTTLEEFARYLPSNVDTLSDSFLAASPLRGSAAFNLRGIGADGTLTLVNGRRIAPFGSSGGAFPFVDINAIPVASIDRIEVLKDGASAIYGSEAVAGVVNIVTRTDFKGITVTSGYLNNFDGDGAEWDVALTAGWTGDATHLVGTLSYYSRDEIWSRDREYSSEIDFSDRGGFNLRTPQSSPPSIIELSTGRQLPDPECPVHDDVNSIRTFIPGVQEWCTFNWTNFTYLQQPVSRLGASASLEHDFGNRATLFGEFLYSDSLTEGLLAPAPIFPLFVPGYHPDNPLGGDLILAARPLDTPRREFDTESITWRALAGLRGKWSDWRWEAALMRSEAESTNTRFNAILAEPFQQAVLGFGGPNADQFYNPFGANTQNPSEVIDQFMISGTRKVESTTETTLDFQVSTELLELGGGALGLALGAQARQQKLSQFADEVELSGQIFGDDRFDPISVDRDIGSVFVEILAPLHEKLDIQLAVRHDDYSDFGGTTNPKVGLGWRPVPEVLIRATWGTSFRPPTFRELHDPPLSGIEFSRPDPHRCPATGDNFDCLGFRPIEWKFQGNPMLEPDEGETKLVGVAWEPASVNGLSLALDFWSIKHDNRITRVRGDIGVALLEQLDPFTNPFHLRAPQTPEDVELGIPGILTGFRETYINAGALETTGVDFDVKMLFDTARYGTFTGGLNYTYLSKYDLGLDFMGASLSQSQLGGYGANGGLPKHRANLQAGWTRGSHGVSLLIPYVGEFNSPTNLVVDEQETEIPFVIDDYFQLDLQYSYTFETLKGATLRVGCRNCTDVTPPVYNYQPFSEAFHEGRGAMFYLRWSQPFR